MLDSMGAYGPAAAMMGAGKGGYASAESHMKLASSDSAMDGANFNDFDDDSTNYYARKASSSSSSSSSASKRRAQAAAAAAAAQAYAAYGADEFARRSDDTQNVPAKSETNKGSESHMARVKRQVYSSSYEEGPCYGFPLEVNVKSRIKLDQIFPIHGKSQFKKCIKVG